MPEEKEKQLILRIKLKAFDHKIIDQSAKQILETAERYGIKVIGPIPLPTETNKFTLNKSSFIHKNSRAQYEMRTHKRLLKIEDPNPKIIDALTNLSLPTGVDIEVKME